MTREELQKVIDYYNKEGYMHPNDINKLIELAEKSFKCCGGVCQEEKP